MSFLYGIIICSSCSQIFSNLLSVSSLLTALIALLHSSKLLLVSRSETGKTIGNGIVAYISFLEIEPSAEMTSQQHHALKTENTSDLQHVQYWHKRLGHPSFGVLERIFLLLLSNVIPTISFVMPVNWQSIDGILFLQII